MVYQNLCETFGALFFLGKIRTVGKTIVVGDKLMTSTPDFAYPLASVPQAGRTQEDCRLLFIVEVKGTPINNVSSECLEEQLDSYVLGQVGSALFAQAKTSAMYPNSLGMICMETKLIFVYLKMPKEHRNLTFPLRTEGKIHYTRPFDMMKAEDRAVVCEFLYWLGCVQNRYGSNSSDEYRIRCNVQGIEFSREAILKVCAKWEQFKCPQYPIKIHHKWL